ncbi:MAG: thiol peroxidase [Bdellovibrionales bacterium]|nr:thiol peroxidase [Bdellovibrionales bacterium]
MASVTLKGNPFEVTGNIPKAGEKVPTFSLTDRDLQQVGPSTYSGKKIVFNIFPSIDTPVCATSVKRFNEEASSMGNTVVLCISRDTPFALKRFCGAEELEHVIPLSVLRDTEFAERFGVRIANGPLEGFCARAIVVADENGKVIYSELVPEIGQEPNYEAAISSLK